MEHLREDVEEILFRLAERAADDPTLARRVVRVVRLGMRLAIWESRLARSPRLFDRLRDLSVRWARWRAPRLRDALGVDVDDLGDLGRIQDWEDRLFQVEGHWVRQDRCTAEKHETQCPFSDLAAAEPRICTELVHELETETFRALNPRYRLVPLERLLSKGDAACVFRHELAPELTRNRHGAQRRAERSGVEAPAGSAGWSGADPGPGETRELTRNRHGAQRRAERSGVEAPAGSAGWSGADPGPAQTQPTADESDVERVSAESRA